MPYPISSKKPRERLHVPLGLPSRHIILHALSVDLPLVALLIYLTVVELLFIPRLGLLLFVLPSVVLITCLFYLLGIGRNFLMKLFNPSCSKAELGSRVWNRVWGWHQFFFPKFLLINSTRLDPPDHWSKWLGGPASLAIHDGFAAYLEYGNHFQAAIGAQVPLRELDPHETIKAIVDLRPQFRDFEVNGWTKDGIKVILAVRVESRIGSNFPPDQADPKLLYPFDPLSVQHAVEATSVKSRDGKLVEADWCERVTGKVKGLLTHHITTRRLDELFLTDRGDGQILSADMLKQLLDEANRGLNNAGIHVSNMQIIGTQIPEDVYGQRLDVWKSAKDSTMTRIHGAAQAYEIRVSEEARARAQRELILSITRSLEGMDPAQFTEVTLLSLSKVLDRGLKDPLVRTIMDKETIALLEELR